MARLDLLVGPLQDPWQVLPEEVRRDLARRVRHRLSHRLRRLRPLPVPQPGLLGPPVRPSAARLPVRPEGAEDITLAVWLWHARYRTRVGEPNEHFLDAN